MRTLVVLITLCWVSAGTTAAQINVLTANYDTARTNANLQETRLTPDTVAPGRFGKLGSLTVDGQVYPQPLYISGLVLPEQPPRNVLFVLTMHNSVYAYDADSAREPVLLWQMNLGPSIPTSLFADYRDIQPEIGILGTGAIDLDRSALYVVSMNLVNGAPAFYLHALDLETGLEKLNGPVPISAAVAGAGTGSSASGSITFDPMWHIQRPGLLLANDAVYIAFGSHGDQWQWHGWLMAYDASDLSRQLGVFMTTRDGLGGSIWQSGRGLAADENGSIYAITGNGDYNGVSNYSQTFLKLSGAAPQLADWFTPFNWQELTDWDEDLSAGPALIPGTHLLLGGDKAGHLYLVNGDSMGRLGNANSSSAQIIDASAPGGIFEFAVWNRSDGADVYLREGGGGVKAFRLSENTLSAFPVSISASTADVAHGGMAISANGADGGILWETTGDHGNPSRPGTLHAFDASDLTRELWNSDMAGGGDFLGTFAKYARPTVANGKVYVPTFSNSVAVYGILDGRYQAAAGGQFHPGGPLWFRDAPSPVPSSPRRGFFAGNKAP